MSLHAGEVIRYESGLWRVMYVNPSRAYIVPVVLLSDGSESEAERRGVSISAGSIVPVVTDIGRTRLEMELEEAEREVAAAKREAALVEELKAAEAEVAAARAEAAQGKATIAFKARTGHGWQLGAVPPEAYTPGSTKALVYAWVAAHPGASTKETAAGCAGQSAGAVAACLDRFRKAGVLAQA